jgi:hypothetical protein
LRKWLKYANTLNDIELVCIYESEVGEILSDEEGRSVSGLINCQEGRNEFSNCQVELRKISVEGLTYYQGGSDENSNFHMGNEMGSLDLIGFQVSSRKFPNFQVGRGKEMRLSESFTNSVESSYQQ